MPYRAMFYTLLAMALAFLIASMWMRAVRPIHQRAAEAENVWPPKTDAWKTIEAAHDAAGLVSHPYRALRKFINGVSLLDLLLICSLLIVGFFATFREWVRLSTVLTPRKRQRTKYVDVWKIAGERAKADNLEDESPPATS